MCKYLWKKNEDFFILIQKLYSGRLFLLQQIFEIREDFEGAGEGDAVDGRGTGPAGLSGRRLNTLFEGKDSRFVCAFVWDKDSGHKSSAKIRKIFDMRKYF